jgi:hypothetical protein
MTWRRVAIFWGCFAALSAYYFAVERAPSGPAVAHLTRAAFVDMPTDRIEAFEVRRGTAVIRCRRVAGRGQVVEPPSAPVPPDLVAALVANLSQLPDVEVVAETAMDLSQFGLDAPASQLTLTPTGGEPVTVRLGTRNPSGTAVYAQRGTDPRVFLIGLNVRYYEDLLFEALNRPAG